MTYSHFSLRTMLLCVSGLLFFILAGCSSSSDNKVPVASPASISITGKDKALDLQWTQLPSMGTTAKPAYATYTVCVNIDDDRATAVCGEFATDYTGGAVQAYIRNTPTAEELALGTYIDYPLENNTEYFVWVRSYFEGYGHGKWITVNKYTIGPAQDAVAPAAEAGDESIQITWQAGANATSYVVVRTDVGGDPEFSENVLYVYGTDAIFPSLANGVPYDIYIKSVNNNGGTDWLKVAGSVTPQPATQKPAAPSVNVEKTGAKNIIVSWKADAAGNNSVKTHVVHYTAADSSDTGSVNVTAYSVDVSKRIAGLQNNKQYRIWVTAGNNAGDTDSNTVTATPAPKAAFDYNKLDDILGWADKEYIYAENPPHSDFWRATAANPDGGRPNSDRLTRGKETALGNLFSDSAAWHVRDVLEKEIDFAFLIGEMFDLGIDEGTIDPKLMLQVVNPNYQEDTIVIVTIKGSYLIDAAAERAVNLQNYPADGARSQSLFGQAAHVYRNGHWGGSGGAINNGKYWGIPSSEVRYVIEYLPYSLEAFRYKYYVGTASLPVGDPARYLLTYDEARPASGNPTATEILGYKRGRIKDGSVTVNGTAIDPNRYYKIATTKRIENSMYTAFVKALQDDSNYRMEDTGVIFWHAAGEYIRELENITPYLDGRVTTEGGVPSGPSRFVP